MPNPPLNVKIQGRGIEQMRSLIKQLLSEGLGKQKLHDRIGIAVVGWIDKNFKSQGLEKPWKPLRPSTEFAKRKAGVGAKALAGLRAWVTHKPTDKHVVVGFPPESPAKYHHYGTKGPYEIRPKNKKALRFLMPPFSSIATGQMRTTLQRRAAGSPRVGLVSGKSIQFADMDILGVKGGTIDMIKSKDQIQSVLFTRIVRHPGLPARPLLPSIQRAEEIAKAVIEDALTEIVRKGGK